MWSLRILSGDMAGQNFELKNGDNTLGRSSGNSIAITSGGISKTHAIIKVQPDKVIITDNKSTNGTFIDGVAIKSQVIQPGQRIAFHDVICEVVATQSIPKPKPTPTPAPAPVPIQQPIAQPALEQPMMPYDGNVAQAPQFNEEMQNFSEPSAQQGKPAPQGIMGHLNQYIDEIVMPGVYKLAEHIEFKNLVMLFCIAFVVLVTSLSTIPLTAILKERTQNISQQRALTIARILATRNEASIRSNFVTGINTNSIAQEAGVSQSYVVDAEGRVLAPPALAGIVPKEPFIAQARTTGDEAFKQIDGSTIGASVPIRSQNGKPLAYAIVMYDMGTNAIANTKTFSLFVQTLIIALLVGSIVFFFLYKIILHPINHLNHEVSRHLRDGHSDLPLEFDFPELQELIQNLSSALARSSGGNSFSEQGQYEHERGMEASGIVDLVGFPAIAVHVQTMNVVAANSHFHNQIAKTTNWTNINLNDVHDQALRLNITELVNACKERPNTLAQDDLEIDNVNYELNGQAVYGSTEVNYVVISFTPNEEEAL